MHIVGNMLVEITIMLKNIASETFINLINYHYISEISQVKMQQAIRAQMAK